MDQDAFRSILASSRQLQQNAKQGTPTAAQKPVTSQPAFKPRKVKKADSKYRDRAAERREGIGNDYAQVETVLEDFQKHAANEDKDVVEQQRKYLGGDSQHTILVKGLDMSLLEQNRARAATLTEDDEVLEQAFAEVASNSKLTGPRKRTREDIIRDLKAKRQDGDRSSDQPLVENSVEDDGTTLEAAKMARKFRPIGFKPIGQTEEKAKKRKVKKAQGKEVKKKKRKVEGTSESAVQSGTQIGLVENMPSTGVSREHAATEAAASSSKTPMKPPEPEPALLDEDFNIFADAGDYEGFPDESDDEHDGTSEPRMALATQEADFSVPTVGPQSWFDGPKPEVRQRSIPPAKTPPIPETTVSEEEAPRLKPLESSALPSIRDFLAMSEAAEKAEKRRARKEKKKKKGTGDDDDD